MVLLNKPQDYQSFPKDAECLFPRRVINNALGKIARQITEDLSGTKPLVLCVMNGGIVFAGKLLPRLLFPLEFGYVDVSRYSSGDTQPDLEIVQKHFPDPVKVTNRRILVLDDILDAGMTMELIRNQLLAMGASRVYSAVLVTKDRERILPRADFSALSVPDRFVFGMGMDYRGLWRNLPQIYALRT